MCWVGRFLPIECVSFSFLCVCVFQNVKVMVESDGGALAPRIDSLGSLKLVCVWVRVSVCSNLMSLIVNCLLSIFPLQLSPRLSQLNPACLAACSCSVGHWNSLFLYCKFCRYQPLSPCSASLLRTVSWKKKRTDRELKRRAPGVLYLHTIYGDTALYTRSNRSRCEIRQKL